MYKRSCPAIRGIFINPTGTKMLLAVVRSSQANSLITFATRSISASVL